MCGRLETCAANCLIKTRAVVELKHDEELLMNRRRVLFIGIAAVAVGSLVSTQEVHLKRRHSNLLTVLSETQPGYAEHSMRQRK